MGRTGSKMPVLVLCSLAEYAISTPVHCSVKIVVAALLHYDRKRSLGVKNFKNS
jgi:hypothetical protein